MNWHEVKLYLILGVKSLYQSVPSQFFIIVSFSTFVGLLLSFLLKGVKDRSKVMGLLLLVEYLFLLYSVSVIFRPLHESHAFDFRFFWSYRAFLDGQNAVMAEKILNLIMFIPVGLLLGMMSGRMKLWKVLLLGGGISVLIETLQFVLKRGYAEFDDVFHNVLGCLVGYEVCVFMIYFFKHFSKQQAKVHDGEVPLHC